MFPFRPSVLAISLLMSLLLPSGKAAAAHQVAHCQPRAADVAFAPDFPRLQDHEWSYRLGGWGGIGKDHRLHHRPVIFIHGNTRDAGDWDEPGKSVKQRFLDAGYSLQELWALSYNGKATKELPPSSQCRTNAQSNVSDVTAFVNAVVAYTGAPKIDIISHSIGVVVVRKMMAEHPEIARLVENFVGIAGPNHGTTVCRRAWLVWLIGWRDFIGCDEITPGSAWLSDLNGVDGRQEARGPTKYLTIYDGTGADPFYLPWLFLMPVRDQDSPALRGAENHRLPGLTHDELRVDPTSTSRYLNFVLHGSGVRPE
jgi:triacylglycerol lipase